MSIIVFGLYFLFRSLFLFLIQVHLILFLLSVSFLFLSKHRECNRCGEKFVSSSSSSSSSSRNATLDEIQDLLFICNTCLDENITSTSSSQEELLQKKINTKINIRNVALQLQRLGSPSTLAGKFRTLSEDLERANKKKPSRVTNLIIDHLENDENMEDMEV